MGGEIIGERGDGVGVPALGGEQHPRPVDIDEQRDVVVAALVDGDPDDVRGVDPRSPLRDIVIDHPPQSGVMLAHHSGHGPDRHGGDHAHEQRLEQQGEAGAVSSSRPDVPRAPRIANTDEVG
jgi:hypothetical protein